MKPAPITLNQEDLRHIGRWAADCAERVLPLFEAQAPADLRPREAIEGIRVFARGGRRTAQLRTLAWAALRAASEIGEPAAAAAARSACLAAGTAYLHPLATPHQSKHILGPAVYAALARELSAGEVPSSGDLEILWAILHAPPAVREILQQLPTRAPGRTRLSVLFYQLDIKLRR